MAATLPSSNYLGFFSLWGLRKRTPEAAAVLVDQVNTGMHEFSSPLMSLVFLASFCQNHVIKYNL